MGRLPYQVLVILYFIDNDDIKYCVFERKNLACQFQFIAGGGEGEELPMQAAIRETFEEAGISDLSMHQLDSICYIPTNIFSSSQRQTWGNEVYVIPEFSFAAKTKSYTIKISNEHIGFEWLCYEDAIKKLKWDSNKTALYEVNCKIKNKSFT